MKFTGGKDNRKVVDGGSGASAKDTDGLTKKPRMMEGTFSRSSLEINDNGTWTAAESGGHHFKHSRAVNSVEASGTWKEEGDKFIFTVVEYRNTNSDRRCAPKDETGKTLERTSSEIKNGSFKSLFFQIDLSPASSAASAGAENDDK